MKKNFLIAISFIFLLLLPLISEAQQGYSITYIDSLVNVLVKERRNWNEASGILIRIGEPAVKPLLAVLSDKTVPEWPRRKAAMTLRDIPSQQIVDPCIQIFCDPEENIDVRINACRALSGKELYAYEDIFLEVAADNDPFLRLVAMHQLWAIGSDQASAIAFKAIKDEHNMVRRAAYEYLSRFDNERVNQVFIEGLFDGDWYAREYIFMELKARGKAVSESLEGIVYKPEYNESIRWSALNILRYIKSYQKIELFFDMLLDPNWMLRNEAVLALYERSDSIPWNVFVDKIDTSGPGKQHLIIWYAGQKGSEASIPWLLDKLKEPDTGWMAAMALGMSGLELAVDPLIEGLKGSDIRKRRACLWALTQIKPENAEKLFLPFLQNEDNELVLLAISALKQLGTAEANAALKEIR